MYSPLTTDYLAVRLISVSVVLHNLSCQFKLQIFLQTLKFLHLELVFYANILRYLQMDNVAGRAQAAHFLEFIRGKQRPICALKIITGANKTFLRQF